MAVVIKITSILLSILLLIPLLSSVRVEQDTESRVRIPPPQNIQEKIMKYYEGPKPSFLHQGGLRMIMKQRKLFMPVLDYEDPRPNPKHDPKKGSPGHP